MFGVERSLADGVSEADSVRDSPAHVVDLLESQVLHHRERLPGPVAGSAVDQVDLLAIELGKIIPERRATGVEASGTGDVARLDFGIRPDVKQDEVRIILLLDDDGRRLLWRDEPVCGRSCRATAVRFNSGRA